jgi:hypothetical protein
MSTPNMGYVGSKKKKKDSDETKNSFHNNSYLRHQALPMANISHKEVIISSLVTWNLPRLHCQST